MPGKHEEKKEQEKPAQAVPLPTNKITNLGSLAAALPSALLPQAAQIWGMTPRPSGPSYFVQGQSFWSLAPEEQNRRLEDLDTYRRGLLQEEEEGRFAVVREGKIASVWDTVGDALQATQLLYGDGLVSVFQVRAQDLRHFGQTSQEEKLPQCQP